MRAARIRLIPNLGAEEGDGWRAHAALPAVSTARRLWRWVFGAPNVWLGLEEEETEDWPAGLGKRPAEAVFDWLAQSEAAFAWLVTEEAVRTAAHAGLVLAGPAPEVVRRVHDKDFAARVARSGGLEPACLRGLGDSFEPAELADPDRVLARISERVGGWPGWTHGRFTLKPRLGSSGRGRVAGEAGEAALRGALPRLAARGGALLEPWLARSEDLSVLLYVPPTPDEPIRLLASLRQRVTAAGLCLGHAGEIDSRGRISSGSPRDESLREAAVAVALAAREAGFHGPCGVDGFVFSQPGAPPREWLRPVNELNARFTTGLVAAGIARRALPWLRDRTGLSPGERRAFYLGLDCPPRHRSWPAAQHAAGPQSRLLPLCRSGEHGGPALLVAPDLGALWPVLAA